MYNPNDPYDPMNPNSVWEQQKQTDEQLRQQQKRILRESVAMVEAQKRQTPPRTSAPPIVGVQPSGRPPVRRHGTLAGVIVGIPITIGIILLLEHFKWW